MAIHWNCLYCNTEGEIDTTRNATIGTLLLDVEIAHSQQSPQCMHFGEEQLRCQ